MRQQYERNRQQLQEQADFFGIDIECLLESIPTDERPPIVLYQNRHVWQLLMTLQTQWEYNSMSGQRQRLNYPAADIHVRRIARREKLDMDTEDQLWDDLRHMEVVILNEDAKAHRAAKVT